MTIVSENLIENTWKRIAALSGNEILKMQKRHRKAQKQLTMLAYSVVPNFREDAAGIAIYVFHVVVEAFQHATPCPARVSRRQIELICEKRPRNSSFDLVRALESSHEPHALQYAYDAFTEDMDDDVVLSENEVLHFLAILETTIECLHQACQR